MKFNTTLIFIVVIFVGVLIFIIVTSITGKKSQKKEQNQRKKIVREEIKKWLAECKNIKNVIVDYESVYARKGAEYKYRDVFDVIVVISEAKTHQEIQKMAVEVEGITRREGKKNYVTNWVVNGEIDLEDTERRIAILNKKIKLSRKEKKLLKKQEQERIRKHNKEIREQNKQKAADAKKRRKNATIDEQVKAKTTKFVPRK